MCVWESVWLFVVVSICLACWTLVSVSPSWSLSFVVYDANILGIPLCGHSAPLEKCITQKIKHTHTQFSREYPRIQCEKSKQFRLMCGGASFWLFVMHGFHEEVIVISHFDSSFISLFVRFVYLLFLMAVVECFFYLSFSVLFVYIALVGFVLSLRRVN